MVDVATLGIAVDTSDLRRGIEALADFGRQSQTTVGHAHETEKAFDEAGHAASEVTSKIRELAAVVGVGLSVEKVYEMAEAWDKALIVIGNFTATTRGAKEDLNALADISLKTSTSLQGNVQIFERMQVVNQQLGLTNKELLNITTAMSASMDLMGRDSADAAESLGLMTRAMQQSVVDGRALNTVIQQMPILAQEMAKHIEGASGSVAQMIALMKEGKVSGTDFAEAIAASSEELAKKSEENQSTVSNAVTNMMTAFSKLFGSLDDGTKTLDHIADGIKHITDALNGLSSWAETHKDVLAILNIFNPFSGGGFSQENIGNALQGMKNLMGRDDASLMGIQDAANSLNVAAVATDHLAEASRHLAEQQTAIHNKALEVKDSMKEVNDAYQAQVDEIVKFIEQADIMKGVKEDNHQLDVEIGEDMKKITAETVRLEEKKQSAYEESGRVAAHINREIQKVSLDVSDQIGGAFFGMIDGQKDAWGSLKNYAVRMMEQMAAAAIINPIVQPIIMSVMGNIMGGVMGGALGSAGGSMIGGAAGGFGAAGLMGGVGGAIDQWGLSQGLGQVSIGSDFSVGVTGGLGSALGYGALGAIGGNLLAGALGMNRTGGSIGGAIGAFGGTLLTPVLGPFGPLIGGAIGSLIGGAFGPGQSNQTEGSILNFGQGTFSTGTSPLPGSSKYSPENMAASSGLTKAGLDLYNTLKSVGLTPGVGSLMVETSAGLHGSPFDVTVDGGGRQGFADSASAGRYIAQQILGSLSNIPSDFQKLIDNIDYSNLDDFVKQLNDLAGFHAALSGIQDQILQMKDPKAYALKQLDAQFQPLIDAANKYGQGLADIEELYGLKREQILQQYGDKSVDVVQKTLDQINTDLSKSFDGQIKIYDDQISAVDNLKQSWAALSNAFAATASGLQLDPSLSILNPEGRRAAAFSQLDAAVARYNGGDMSAAQDIQNLAKEALTASRDVYASSQQYTEDFNRVMGILADAHSSADTQVSLASSQLNVLIQIRDALTTQRSMIPGSPGASYTASDLDALNSAYASSQSASGMSPGDFAGSALGQGYITQLIAEIGGVTDTDRLKSDYKSLSADPGNATWMKIAGVIGSRLRQLGVPGYAMGTNSAIGGLSIVGESGPELMNVPSGAQIATAGQTSNILQFDPKALTSRQEMTIMTTEAGFKSVVIELAKITRGIDSLTRNVSRLGTVA